MDKEKFYEIYALSQRTFPQGIGWQQSFKIKNSVLLRYGIGKGEVLWDVPDNVLEEIIRELRNEFIRIREHTDTK